MKPQDQSRRDQVHDQTQQQKQAKHTQGGQEQAEQRNQRRPNSKYATWNINGNLASNIPRIDEYINTHKPDILTLTETKLYSYQHGRLHNLHQFNKEYLITASSHTANNNNRHQCRLNRIQGGKAGVITMIRRPQHYTEINTQAKGLAGHCTHTIVDTHTSNPTHIIGVYITPGNKHIREKKGGTPVGVC